MNVLEKIEKTRPYKARNNLAKNKIKVSRALTKNGNGYTVNIPRALIKKFGLTDNLILEEDGDRIIIYKAV